MRYRKNRYRWRRPCQRGFTLIELMVSMVILSFILLVVYEVVESTRSTFAYTKNKVSQFRTARAAFETMTRRISQSVLNTYWDYDDPANPKRYEKQSELHFVVGPSGAGWDDVPELLGGGSERPTHGVFFQAPFGRAAAPENSSFEQLLNAWGYYIEFGSDTGYLPPFLRGRPGMGERLRFRLMEFRPASEQLHVYLDDLKNQNQNFDFFRWFREQAIVDQTNSRPIAENIIALIISPVRSQNDLALDSTDDVKWDIAPNYYYDSREWQRNPAAAGKRHELSRHQLPSLLQITMVTIDEASAIRLEEQYGSSIPDFQLGPLFQEVENYDADLQTLEATLKGQKLNYHVFTNTVIMRAAKWSSAVGE